MIKTNEEIINRDCMHDGATDTRWDLVCDSFRDTYAIINSQLGDCHVWYEDPWWTILLTTMSDVILVNAELLLQFDFMRS